MTRIDQYTIARYILNRIIENPGFVEPSAVLTWAEDNSENLVGCTLEEYWDTSTRRLTARQMIARRRRARRDIEPDDDADTDDAPVEKPERNLKTLQKLLNGYVMPDIFAPGADTSMDAIARAFHLSRAARRVFGLLAYVERYPLIGQMVGSLTDQHFLHDLSIKQAGLLSVICGVRRDELLRILANTGELFQTGLARIASDGDIELYTIVRTMVIRGAQTATQIKRDMLGQPQKSELVAANFAHIATDYEYVRTLLKCAVNQHKQGINILLYGAPGTGKTEFAKSVCNSIGVDLFNLDQSVSDRESRMSTLIRCSRMTRNDRNTVLLFDEAEDIFSSYEKRTSKLFLNQMLEDNCTPTIWISNDISDMDPAFLRRFQYITEIRKPVENDRSDIWRKICTKHNLDLSDDEISEYSRRYDIAPSMIESAVSGVVLTGKKDSLTRTLDNMQVAISGSNSVAAPDENKFLPSLLNTDTDLVRLADCLVRGQKTRFSLCLYGASGTGKSAYAVYLARRLGLQYIHVRASDLKGKYVGETEKNIAQAFRKAADSHSILIFDEADSFLQDRETAQQQWQISAVNEMLTHMESHPYPFICTTNLMDKLDAASLRRFSFKVKYDFMNADQVRQAFKHFLNIDLDEVPRNLTKLTPGDFVVVRNKCEILDIHDTNEIIELLDSEQRVKNRKSNPNKIGF